MRKNWLVKLERQTIDQKKIIRKADITMVDDERKTTKNEKMSMKENERLLIEKFKMIKPVEKSYEEQAKTMENSCKTTVQLRKTGRCCDPDGWNSKKSGF